LWNVSKGFGSGDQEHEAEKCEEKTMLHLIDRLKQRNIENFEKEVERRRSQIAGL
jgi:hypothetical protein